MENPVEAPKQSLHPHNDIQESAYANNRVEGGSPPYSIIAVIVFSQNSTPLRKLLNQTIPI